MRILVTGAYGFIGSQVVVALTSAGHEVVCAVRRPALEGRFAHLKSIACEFTRDVHQNDWLPRLTGIEAVVNCAGILREGHGQYFDVVHRLVPIALFNACLNAGVKKVVQISALGVATDTDFIRSKYQADDYLSGLNLDWVIIRPSVVFTQAGSYGGSSLLRALAALPYVLLLPGKGAQPLQPIYTDDLARAVVRMVETDNGNRQILQAVGPEILTLESFLLAIRCWLGLPKPVVIRIPLWLIQPLAWIGETFGRGPLGKTMLSMLQRGNTGLPDAVERFNKVTGFTPRTIHEIFAASPSFVQDRWHAQLYFLAPVLRITLGLLWLMSGLVGFIHPIEDSAVILRQAGLSSDMAAPVVYSASVVDLMLGAALLIRYHIHAAGMLMILSLLMYTVYLGVTLPSLWLEPFGSLIKNIPLIPAVLIMMVLDKRR